MADLAWFAGVKDYQLPPAGDPHASGLSGPTAEDMENAQDMEAGDRQAMIEGMVSQLADRLATEGGTPEEWARLISAYGVLGDRDRAALIWEEAQEVFAGSPAAVESVREGARNAGVAP